MVRAGADAPEVFMVRRNASSSFASAYAFPGGVLDEADSKVDGYCGALTDPAANTRLGLPAGGLAYYSAAIRELFEEAGVLMADCTGLDEDLAAIRDGLIDGSVDWATFVAEHGLTLHCSELHYFSHWVTPPGRPKRYSTRFFLAQIPEGQVANHCGVELTESQWVAPSDMLAAGRRADVKLHFPTVKTLESLARHHTLGEMLDWASSCVEWGVTSMIPLIIKRHGRDEIVLPGDKDYPGAKS